MFTQQLTENILGRDFIIGDLHGMVGALERLLEKNDFDVTKDRVISVGDLVDRGDRSVDAINLLDNDWFYACRGNHEALFLDSIDGPLQMEDWVNNGGDWLDGLSASQNRQIRTKLRALPYLIEFKSGPVSIGVIHAQVPDGMSWGTLKLALERRDPVVIEMVTWLRDRYKEKNTLHIEGIDELYVGHVITRSRLPETLGNVHFIDTGAFLSIHGYGSLTAAIYQNGIKHYASST